MRDGSSAEIDPPSPIAQAFAAHAGRLLGQESLAGMSFARVGRLRGERGSAILKITPNAVEAAFYTRVAPSLRAAGVPLPGVFASCTSGGYGWLLLEDLPLPAPPASDDGRPDARMVAALTALHRATHGAKYELPASPNALWSDGANDAEIEAALAVFPVERRWALGARIRRFLVDRGEARPHWCWISGDPNPRNWGQRTDGSVALFDWELFQAGHPATDLAISVAGLGSSVAFRALACDYLAAFASKGQIAPCSAEQLAAAMARQKLLTVVRLLAGSTRASLQPLPGLIDALVQRVPNWLESLDAERPTSA